MVEIPLVRVRYADSFAQILNRVGAPTERLLNQVGLSEQMLTVRDGYMPVGQLWEFTALAAGYTGLPNIGLMSGMTPLEQHSGFGSNLLYAPNLYQAIMKFCETARAELSNANFHIWREPDTIWFCGGRVEGSADEVRQVELYRIGMIVQVIRWAAGSDWKPQKLHLQSPDARSLQDNRLFRNTNIRTGSHQPAVGFPLDMLHLPLMPEGSLEEGRPGNSGLTPALEGEPDFTASIKEVIRTHVRARRRKIKDVARTLDMPVRTLQRHLASSGLTFSQLLDQTRIEIAMVLLEDADLKISDVAGEIGYSNPTHFSRAFRRITGVMPRQYRTDRGSGK